MNFLKSHVSGIHLAVSFLVALSFVQLFSPLGQHTLVIGLVILVVLLIAGGLAQGILALVAPLSILSLLLILPILSGAIYGLQGTAILTVLAASSIAVAIGFGSQVRLNSERRASEIQSLVAAFAALPIAWFWSRGTNESALRFLAASGEDNAAWLQGMSSNIDGAGKVFLSPDSDWSGGPLLSVFHFVSQSLHGTSLKSNYILLDNTLALTREYGFVLVVCLISMLLLVQKIGIAENRSLIAQLPFIAVSFVIAYAGFSAVMFSGHLSLLIVIALILAASISDLTFDANGRLHLFPVVIAASVVISTALAWIPIAPMVATFLFLVSLRIARTHFSISDFKNLGKIQAAIYFFIAGVVVWALNAAIGGILSIGTRLQYVRELLSYLGQTVVPSMWILFALITGVIILARRDKLSDHGYATITLTLVISSLIYVSGLVIASRFGVKFTLNYAALKYLLFVCVAFLPIGIAAIHSFLVKTSKGISSALVSLGVLILFLVDGSIGQYISYPWSLDRSMSTWVNVAAKELTRSPDKVLLCMSTSDRNLDYEAYKCGRILYSLQGNAENMQIDQWSAMNLDMTDFKVLNEIPKDFYSKTIIIQLGAPSEITGVETRDEWLRTVDWEIPKIVSGN